MSIQVVEFRPVDAAEWDEFVRAHPHGSVFHLDAWRRSLEDVFGYGTRSLIAREEGRVAGVLPLYLIKNFILGRVLISSPFAVYGGILAESPEARQLLFERAAQMARSLRVEHLELRNSHEEQCVGLPRIDRYVTFKQALSPGSGEDLLAGIHKKTRNMVRKALKFDYASRMVDGLDNFYEIIARSYRRHGTPLFPRQWFEALRTNFGPLADVREILLDGRIAGASMNFLFRGEMHTYYAASDEDLWDKAPNNFLYYDHLLWASNNGYATFDFGRSKRETGNFEFKRHWAAEMRELPYEILLVKRREMPDFTPKNPKFELAIKAWRRLPLWVTKALGPRLVRLFP